MSDLTLPLAGGAVFIPALAAFLTGRIKGYQYSGFMAIAFAVWAIDDIRRHRWGSAAWECGFVAWEAWSWWKGGGGDNTKRRLRRLRRAFTPARRTAPAAA